MMSPTTRRIALETYQRSLDAIANKETEGAEFDVWWDRLAGVLQSGMAGPRTWKRLWGIAEKMVGGTPKGSNERVDVSMRRGGFNH
jgi:hypothetical protein